MSINAFKILRSIIIKIFLIIVLGVFTPTTSVNAIQSEEPKHIYIPSAAISLPVQTAAIAYNTWEVSDTTASFGAGSSLPGTVGNTVVFAHAREGLFGNLPQVKVGDLIYLFTDHDWYYYRVTDRMIVAPTQTGVIQNSNGAELTLFTCTGPGDSHRLVLKAVLE